MSKIRVEHPPHIWVTGTLTTGSWNSEPTNPRLATIQTGYTKDDILFDLLDALIGLRECIMETRGPNAHDAVDKADAAIAKAKGEQNE